MRDSCMTTGWAVLSAALLATSLGCSSGSNDSKPPESGGNEQADAGPQGCVPTSCASLGADCGVVDDGCGATLDCGACVEPETCGGGGTPNVCGGGCVPVRCEDLGKNCGLVPDGCGDFVNYGACGPSETCGGGGQANVCGEGPCTPTTCAAEGKECGTIGDGCGGVLDCGACAAPETCGGGGEANTCAKPSTQWEQVSAGATHTCALDSAGALSCWGANDAGQLGTGDYTSRSVPTPVDANETWAFVSAGAQTTYAVTSGGKLYRWGQRLGVLGADTSPVEAPATAENPGSPWVSVSSKWGHVCGTKWGHAYCWGDNAEGQLGDTTTEPSLSPNEVYTLDPPKVVSAGRDHSCLVTGSSPPLCAGNNWYGQLGSSYSDSSLVFVAADTLKHHGWVWAEAGGFHSCAVHGTTMSKRTLWCWGDNTDGQVGDVDGGGHQMVQVGGQGAWVALSAGHLHTCAVGNWDELSCWGDNSFGQVGSGGPATEPVPVGIAGSWLDVSAGYSHSCALKTDGSLWCWGNYTDGQLGDGTTSNRSVPNRVL